MALWLYLDQNYLSGMAKAKPAFAGLEPLLRIAVASGRIAIPESPSHERESAPRPDLRLLELLRSLSGGLRLPPAGPREAALRRRLAAALAQDAPQRRARPSDEHDLDALSRALPCCEWVTCDAHMAAVVAATGAVALYNVELFPGRRSDVLRLEARLRGLLDEV